MARRIAAACNPYADFLFDAGEMPVVLAEQGAEMRVVVKAQIERRRGAARRLAFTTQAGASITTPDRPLVVRPVTRTRARSPIVSRELLDVHRLHVRGPADQLPGVATGALEQHGQRAPDGTPVERLLLAGKALLQRGQALVLHLFGDLRPDDRRRGPGPRAVFERERAGEADLVDQRQRIGEVGGGSPPDSRR